MNRTLRAVTDRLTYANVASTVALVAALGTGTAYAANTVRSEDIVNGQVKTVDLHQAAVNGAKIKDGQVGTADVADGSIGQADIATDGVGASEVTDNSIDSGEIVDGGLFAADLATGSVGSSEVADSSLGSADIANNSLTTADIAGTDVNGSFITLNAGVIPAQRCRTFSVAIGGAQVGEAVLFSTKVSLPDGIFVYGQNVSAVNQVKMIACNGSTVASPQLTNIPVRVLTFG